MLLKVKLPLIRKTYDNHSLVTREDLSGLIEYIIRYLIQEYEYMNARTRSSF